MFIEIDKRRKVVIPGDAKETVAFAAHHFINCASEAIEQKGKFFVALSGGSTPKQIFETLVGEYKNSLDWKKVYLFWSDERSVGADHPDSNYKMAMDHGFSHLPVDKNHIFRMKGEENIDANALEYEATIKKILEDNPFDLIMLGIGEDGHTASLFPGTKALDSENRLVVANHVPQKNTWRMTFTFPLINSANHIAIYALGDTKTAILNQVFTTDNYPASKIGTEDHPALWILDDKAGQFLNISDSK